MKLDHFLPVPGNLLLGSAAPGSEKGNSPLSSSSSSRPSASLLIPIPIPLHPFTHSYSEPLWRAAAWRAAAWRRTVRQLAVTLRPFDLWTVGPASQLRQRKVIIKFRGPERDQRRDDRLKGLPNRGAKGPGGRAIGMERPTQQATGRAPRPGHDMCWPCARRCSAICSRGSCCPRINSILRRFVQGARPTHDRPKTALCATRAPPKRQVGRRARDARRRPSTAALAL